MNAHPPAAPHPDWIASLMPPGYENRLAEIQRLSAELRSMDRFASLLLESGVPLESAARDLFTAMKFELDSTPAPGAAQIGVRLDNKRRLLLCVAETADAIQRKDASLERAFQLLTQLAGPDDRVALIASGDPSVPPAQRPTVIAADALDLLTRLGVNVIPSPVLFALWSVSLQDLARARAFVDRLHAQNGGLCAPPPAVARA